GAPAPAAVPPCGRARRAAAPRAPVRRLRGGAGARPQPRGAGAARDRALSAGGGRLVPPRRDVASRRNVGPFRRQATSRRAGRRAGTVRAGAGPPVSGSGEIGGAAVVELGGSGPPGEQGPAGLEVPARGELAEEDGVEAETVQERSHPVRGTRIVGGDGERPTLRV